jgi:hypothetical protein
MIQVQDVKYETNRFVTTIGDLLALRNDESLLQTLFVRTFYKE